jgi:hypothetical protein
VHAKEEEKKRGRIGHILAHFPTSAVHPPPLRLDLLDFLPPPLLLLSLRFRSFFFDDDFLVRRLLEPLGAAAA